MEKLQRGNKLWHMKFVLPEHDIALKHWHAAQDKISKPTLDEQELAEIGHIVMDSLRHELEVKIIYWVNGGFDEIIGVVDHVDQYEKYIKVRAEDDILTINVDCLISVIYLSGE
ncbi:YolD-like family protein [Bacillus sp. JCM 19034]|uniref:YolD-like family protein n=1 Tax=Bacillus sp. JCM 19034 TaxID=1481928 RepID=UPI000781A943|nr:YolD-like family protein [Bacillus sp. JCM 19034]